MKQSLSLLIGAVLASLVPQPPSISPTVREFLAGWEMVDLPIDTQGHTVRVARYTGSIQIVNGSGAEHETNATGNLIVGYNPPPAFSAVHRLGSHNIVLGKGANYSATTYGGIVGGEDNRLNAPLATILGGVDNSVDSYGSVVVSGVMNRVSTFSSTAAILGGHRNSVDGLMGTIAGGRECNAYGEYSTVSGGRQRSTLNTDDWAAGSLYEDQ